jgi:hypothetical protein
VAFGSVHEGDHVVPHRCDSWFEESTFKSRILLLPLQLLLAFAKRLPPFELECCHLVQNLVDQLLCLCEDLDDEHLKAGCSMFVWMVCCLFVLVVWFDVWLVLSSSSTWFGLWVVGHVRCLE